MSSVLKQLFFVLYELRFVFYFLLCGMQGVHHVVEFERHRR